MDLEAIEEADNHYKLKIQGLPEINVDGWNVGMEGVSYSYEDKERVVHVVYVSLVPVIISADIIVDNTWKTELTYWNGDKFVTAIVENRILSSNTSITKLADIGIPCTSTNSKKLVQYFYDLRRLNPIPRKVCVQSLGWYGEEFAPYSNKVITNLSDDILDQFKGKGTLLEWIDIVKPLLNNDIVRVSVASAFASVLIKPLSLLSFLTYIHGGSGTGKTVACMVAMSAWMNPDKQANPMFRKFSDTANSLMSMAAVMGCLPMCIDEFQVSRHKGDDIVMNLCEGSEPGRLNKDSSRKKALAWNNSFLANGEVSILDNNSGGGTVNRVIECDCGSDMLFKNPVGTVSAIKKCYGTAGREFLKHISEAEKIYKDCCSALFTTFKTVPDKQIMAAATIATADSIMSKHIFNIEPMPIGSYANFLKSDSEVSKSERAWDFIMGLILEHKRNFKTGKTDGDSVNFWGYVYDNGRVYILKKVIDEKMKEAGYNLKECQKNWHKQGRLIKKADRYSCSTSAGGIKDNYVVLYVDDKELICSITQNEMIEKVVSSSNYYTNTTELQ